MIHTNHEMYYSLWSTL